MTELRKYHDLSQEELAEKIGVSRQTLSKYETGESLPDIEKSKLLADVFGVSVDDLISYDKNQEDHLGLGVPPKGKHIFGMVKVVSKVTARMKKAEEPAPEEPKGPTQEELLAEIRDLLKAQK